MHRKVKNIHFMLFLSLSTLFLIPASIACVRQSPNAALASKYPTTNTFLDVERAKHYTPSSGPVSQARDISKIYGDKSLDRAYDNWVARGKPKVRQARQYALKGKASWYGPGLNGNKTASGQVFDMYGMTAAHKKLPFGTIVKVKNLDNGKSVVVRITDRGPFIKGRVIDLSFGAAQLVGMIQAGVVPVVVEIIDIP